MAFGLSRRVDLHAIDAALLDGPACAELGSSLAALDISVSAAFRVGRGGQGLAGEVSEAKEHRCDDC